MERTFGFTLAAIRERTDVEFLSSNRYARSADRVVLDGGRPVETIETVPTADGSVRHFLVTRFPFTEPDGRLMLGGTAVDVTALKQSERRVGENERRYRHLVE